MMHMSTPTRVPNVATVSTVKLSHLITVGVSDTVALPTIANMPTRAAAHAKLPVVDCTGIRKQAK